MQLLKITVLKEFTKQLFIDSLFDDFLFIEGNAQTFSTFNIDGNINYEYYSKEDCPTNKFNYWKSIKPIFFQIIKGKTLPLEFKIVLSYNDLTKLFQDSPLSGAYLNIKYAQGILTVTTGVSYNNFTLDKSFEKAWDTFIMNLFTENNISFDIC